MGFVADLGDGDQAERDEEGFQTPIPYCAATPDGGEAMKKKAVAGLACMTAIVTDKRMANASLGCGASTTFRALNPGGRPGPTRSFPRG